ncbi:unnamed protein product, partial [Cyprideis torosa]
MALLAEERQNQSPDSGTTSIPLTRVSEKVRTFFAHIQSEHLIAGITGGVAATLICHPLDLVKLRFAVNEGGRLAHDRPQYGSLLNAFHSIRHSGGIRSLYQGVGPNVWGAGTSWGFYFLFYNAMKD